MLKSYYFKVCQSLLLWSTSIVLTPACLAWSPRAAAGTPRAACARAADVVGGRRGAWHHHTISITCRSQSVGVVDIWPLTTCAADLLHHWRRTRSIRRPGRPSIHLQAEGAPLAAAAAAEMVVVPVPVLVPVAVRIVTP